jgi:hypothetical protein
MQKLKTQHFFCGISVAPTRKSSNRNHVHMIEHVLCLGIGSTEILDVNINKN